MLVALCPVIVRSWPCRGKTASLGPEPERYARTSVGNQHKAYFKRFPAFSPLVTSRQRKDAIVVRKAVSLGLASRAAFAAPLLILNAHIWSLICRSLDLSSLLHL
jgi:hypothetical protein